jgi:uncharacterized protein YlzI (FlbEa/FlbD family)
LKYDKFTESWAYRDEIWMNPAAVSTIEGRVGRSCVRMINGDEYIVEKDAELLVEMLNGTEGKCK